MNPDDAIFERIERCRLCGSTRLQDVIDLGHSPLADQLLRPADLGRPEHRVPLAVAFCPDCSLLQLRETVRPGLLFNERYPYHSSVSPSLRSHFEAYANRLIPSLRDGAFVVEAGSNDGCLLKHFAAAGARCLGIDPAQGPDSVARRAGIPTERAFFGEALAREIRGAHGPCDLFLANNVLAHVADLHGFVRGIGHLLNDGGTAVLEVPHVVPLVEGLEFDTVYHQHLCYFSLASLDTLFSRHGLALCDAEPLPVNGGSLRLTIRRAGEPSRRLNLQIEDETARGALGSAYYRDFAKRVSALRERLLDTLASCRASGSIAAYGAAAKACTLLHYCGIDRNLIDYVVDLNPHKHGLFMPGNRLPILPVERLREDPPAFLLILAWNLAEEIMAQLADLAAAGTRFIIPIPEPRILTRRQGDDPE